MAVATALGTLFACSLLEPGGLLSPERGDPQTLYVSRELGSDDCHGRRPDCPLKSLAVAVEEIAPGGTIKVHEDYQEIERAINIWRPVTIEGGYDASFNVADGWSIYSGTGMGGTVFTLSGNSEGAHIVVKNVDIRNAFSPTWNGAAAQIHSGAVVDLENCIFSNNTSLQLAGAADVSGASTATFSQCVFRSNRSFRSPSVIHIYRADAAFEGCEFDSNIFEGDTGGALIHLTTNAAHSVSFQDCVFTNTTGTFVTTGGEGDGQFVDLGGNVGMQPAAEDVAVVFIAWATGIAGATTVVSGPDTDGDESTTVMENADGSIEITAVVNAATGEGTYTYVFTDYADGDYTYNGTITAATTGNPPTTFDYTGELTLTGSDLESIAFDYTLDGTALSGTITIDGEYEYDLSELGY